MRMLAIPPIVPSFDVCKIIHVHYVFKVVIKSYFNIIAEFQIKIVTRSHFNRSVSGEAPILIGTIPVRHVVPPQNLTVLNQDYLVPPQPTPLQKDESQPLLNSIFGFFQ